MKLRIASLLAPALLTACGESAPPPPPAATPAPAGPNAADVYRDCFRRIDPDLMRVARSVRITSEGATIEPGAGFRDFADAAQVLAQRQTLVRKLIDASKMDRCDFGLGSGEADVRDAMAVNTGFRDSARVLIADAGRLAEAGDPGGAAARLGAIYGMIAHAARQPVITLGLTNEAVLMVTSQSVGALAAAEGTRRLRPEDARALEAAIARLDPNDPVGYARASAADPSGVGGLGARQNSVKSVLREARDALARVK